jgi:hypothetical protein
MKEHKQLRPVSVDRLSRPGPANDDVERGETVPRRPPESNVTEAKTLRPDRVMLTEDDDAGKGRGRLTRETLGKLGKTLEAYYDDVRKQGVPDRFRQLLQQMDDRRPEERREHDETDTQDKEAH